MKAKLNLNLNSIYFYTLVILCLLCFHLFNVQQAMGSQSKNEPNVSLKVKNLPMNRVLNSLAQDTGIDFQINDQWKTYPVNVSIEAQPLHQALKQILRGLNHTIIYESGKSVKIVVYGKMETQNKNPFFTRHSSFSTQRDEPETEPLHDSDFEEPAEFKVEDESFSESDPSEETDNENTKGEILSTVQETDEDASEDSNIEDDLLNEDSNLNTNED